MIPSENPGGIVPRMGAYPPRLMLPLAEHAGPSDFREPTLRWHVLWTRSNCEQLVYEQLSVQGFELWLPMLDKWARRKHVRVPFRAPMFPGYLFVREAVDRTSYTEISRTRGMVRILGERWDKLATVPDREIEAIRQVHESDTPGVPHAYLQEGQRVRITKGPLTDVEGFFVKTDARKGLLVLSIEMLRRSLAVKVNRGMVAAI